MTEDISKAMENMGKQFSEFKETVVKQLKNMEVEVQAWSFNVGKGENEYIVEMSAKVAVRKKK